MFRPENDGTGIRSYMDVDTGDISIYNDNNGSVMHIPGRKK